MSTKESRVVLVTGASSGIGRAIAQHFAQLGFKVYGTSRKQGQDGQEEQDLKEGWEILQLDVCSDASVKAAVEYVLGKEGRIDILVNNAGFGIAGAVEDTTPEEAFSQFDTNFFGVLRMCRSVLPVMRQQKKGLIINISSVAGLISIPFQSMYSSSKFALEAMTECLRQEVASFGIRVVLIEPGDTRTGFTQSRRLTEASRKGTPYSERFKRSVETMIRDESNGPGPEIVARAVIKAAGMRNPPVRIVVGFSYKLFAILKRILPTGLTEFIVSKMYA